MNRTRYALVFAALCGTSFVIGAVLLASFDSQNGHEESRAIRIPESVRAPLRAACLDCHSNETVWPWYSRFFPATVMIIRDVRRGRQELNFSEWESYPASRKLRKLQWVGRALEKDSMPPGYYRLLHPDSVLDARDRAGIAKWAEDEAAALAQGAGAEKK